MFGLSSTGKDAIGAAIEKMFDKLALQLLGEIPKLQDKKFLLFGVAPELSLAHVFLQAMNNQTPNYLERDALKSMLDSAFGYVEALKNKTKSNVTERIDSLVKDAKAQNRRVAPAEVQQVFAKEMEKAQSGLKLIAEAESTKTRNVGHALNITRAAATVGDQTPTVFFVIVRDGETCKECMKLHMMPDKTTPRLWKLSEVSSGYHVRGEDRPSSCGEHPNCRCTMTYLPSGFGFKNGFIQWISPNFDAYRAQRAA